MVWFRVLLPVLGTVLVAADEASHWIHGVEPSKQKLYVGDANGKWTCLNDSLIELSVEKINDGVCDCPDGSDEPGTGACGDIAPYFYCRNEGFISKRIAQSKVNDGVCDCCDCSDELLSSVEPFYRGSTCSELQEAFDRIKSIEWQKHEEGSRELRRLYRRFQLDNDDEKVDKQILGLEIEKISEELVDAELELASVRAKHMEQLSVLNPLMYNFEQLDANYLAFQINSSFDRVVEVSQAFEELVHILETLGDRYSRSLNDRVVNDNVKRFHFLKSQTLKKMSCDSKVEDEQRLQLSQYFEEELPQMFMEGRTDKPSHYITGKISFVENMVFGKVNYIPTVMAKIKLLKGLMSDVAENYNVNYQDLGVKEAVESYKHWLTKYRELDEAPKLLTEEFSAKFKTLQQFINANADKILAADSGSEEQSNFQNVMQHWNYLTRKVASFFKADLGNQIISLENKVEQLRKMVELKREEYHAFEIKEKGHGSQELARLVKLVNALSQGHALQNLIDNYVYEINLGGSIYQAENTPAGNQVKIGQFQGMRLQKDGAKLAFFEYLKSTYPDEDDLFPALVSEIASDQEQYLFGNIDETTNDLLLEYAEGDRCWNGPKRSALLKVRCAKDFQITKVYEMTKCNYGIEMAGPIGCNLS